MADIIDAELTVGGAKLNAELSGSVTIPARLNIGIPGKDGAAATVEVGTVTTGEPGTEACVTNSGTENAAVLDFVIPRGADGEKGDKGDTGEKGEKGDAGADAELPNGTVGQILRHNGTAWAAANARALGCITVGTMTSGHTAAECDYLCDGVSDEAEILAAVTAAESSSGAISDVCILPGYYSLNAPLDLSGMNFVTIRSAGVVTWAFAYSSSPEEGTAGIALGDRMGLEGIRFDAAGISPTYAVSVPGSKVRISRCRFTGLGEEISGTLECIHAQGVEGLLIEDCEFDNCFGNVVHLIDATFCRVVGNSFYGCMEDSTFEALILLSACGYCSTAGNVSMFDLRLVGLGTETVSCIACGNAGYVRDSGTDNAVVPETWKET